MTTFYINIMGTMDFDSNITEMASKVVTIEKPSIIELEKFLKKICSS